MKLFYCLMKGGVLWLLLLIGAILPFTLLSFHNYPSIHDDYGNAINVLRLGRTKYIRTLHHNWTGRYTEMVLKAYINPLLYRQTVWLARVQPVAVILLMVTGAHFFFRMLLCVALPSVIAACALLLTVLYLNGSDEVASSLYWFGGYTSVTAGVIASLFAFAGLLGLLRYQGQMGSQLVCLVVAAGFSLVGVGSYDVSMVAICWVLGSAVTLAWLLKHLVKWWFAAVFLVALLGAYITVTAPGNQVWALGTGRNLGAVLESPQVVIVAVKSFYFALTQSLAWANSLLLLLGNVLLASLITCELPALPVGRVHPVMLVLWPLVGMALMVFPSALVYQAIWPHSWQCVYIYFLLAWVGLVTVLLARYQSGLPGGSVGWGVVAAAFCGLCFISGGSNTHRAYLDLLSNTPNFYGRVQ